VALLAGFATGGWLVDEAALLQLRNWSAAAVPSLAVLVTFVGFVNARRRAAVRNVDVPIAGLPLRLHGFSIVQISDVHVGATIKHGYVSRIVDAVNALDADMIAVTGDLVDGSVGRLSSHTEPLSRLCARHGAFFVTGNHEYFVDDTVSWLVELERLGVQPLRNENTVIRRGAAAFDLVGVNDVAGERRSNPPDFDRALSGVDGSRPTILLAHQPVQVKEASARGVDLQLSGHGHGGQMWPFHYVVRAVQPSLAGLSTVDETQLYVTRGAGFWGPPVRVGAPPDITVLSLEAGQ